MSVVIHEVSHGYVAELFGDKTARYAGRLTLNPIRHLDLFGSVILPALLYFTAGFVFGWAKPVPYNPANLRNERLGTLAVASAGVLANFFIAAVFGLLIRVSWGVGLPESFYFITSNIVIINLVLGIFNLVPIPPLDGSKILFSILPPQFSHILHTLEQFSFFLVVLFIIFFANQLFPILSLAYTLLTGLAI